MTTTTTPTRHALGFWMYAGRDIFPKYYFQGGQRVDILVVHGLLDDKGKKRSVRFTTLDDAVAAIDREDAR